MEGYCRIFSVRGPGSGFFGGGSGHIMLHDETMNAMPEAAL